MDHCRDPRSREEAEPEESESIRISERSTTTRAWRHATNARRSMEAVTGDEKKGTEQAERSSSWGSRFWRQYPALMKKQVLVSVRNWKSTMLMLFASFFFVFLIFIVNASVTAARENQAMFSNELSPALEDVTPIPDCKRDFFLDPSRSCYTFLYQPTGDEQIEAIVDAIKKNNDPPIPDDRVRGFSSREEINEFLLEHPESVLGALHFDKRDEQRISFVLQTNSTVKFWKGNYQDPNFYAQLPLQMATEREIVRNLAEDPDLEWSVSYSDFAHPAIELQSVVGTIGGSFLFAAAMFGFTMQMSGLVWERETRLRQSMATMGMLDSAYWCSWISWELVLMTISSLLICCFGLLFQFDLFLDNSFGILFLLFLLFEVSMAAFALFISAFVSSASSSIFVGFAIFIVGWAFQVVVIFGFPFEPEFSTAAQVIFAMLPWNLLAKGLYDLGQATATSDSPGISWSERFSYCLTRPPPPDERATYGYYDDNCVVPLGQMFWIFPILFVAFAVLGIYLDNVLPDTYGNRRALLYFLYPSYWVSPKPDHGRTIEAEEALMTDAHRELGLSMDADVLAEALRMKKRCRAHTHAPEPDSSQAIESARSSAKIFDDPDANTQMVDVDIGSDSSSSEGKTPLAIEMFGLSKKYRIKPKYVCRGGCRSCWRHRPKLGHEPEYFHAVCGNWIGVEEGELFCLLGPNGAGKTTTINCLTGVMPPTSGDALVCGESIMQSGGLDRIRSFMGVCPQFDVQWPELTGYEHLKLFADLKGIPLSKTHAEAMQLLQKVKLEEAMNACVSTYSGGMKRRLSVAMALLGDPKVVYLDEPTTGMDPISRRHVWDIIQDSKKGRCIILTTHSMEEADILGDRIGIMARGHLRCLGHPLHLKKRFGTGYKVSISVKKPLYLTDANIEAYEENIEKVCSMFVEELGVQPSDRSEAYIHFIVQKDRAEELGRFFSLLDDRKEECNIMDVQLSLASLEEVFLNIVRQAELEHANKEGRTVMIMINGTEEVNVPVGVETYRTESGELYKFKWGQGESGEFILIDYERDNSGETPRSPHQVGPIIF